MAVAPRRQYRRQQRQRMSDRRMATCHASRTASHCDKQKRQSAVMMPRQSVSNTYAKTPTTQHATYTGIRLRNGGQCHKRTRTRTNDGNARRGRQAIRHASRHRRQCHAMRQQMAIVGLLRARPATHKCHASPCMTPMTPLHMRIRLATRPPYEQHAR